MCQDDIPAALTDAVAHLAQRLAEIHILRAEAQRYRRRIRILRTHE